MRADQYQRLKTLIEKLTDVVLDEADPASWPGEGMTTQAWRALELADSKEAQRIRGDRYWSKKNASATLSLITKTLVITGMVEHRSGVAIPTEDDVDIDKDIAKAEREAAKILKKVQDRAYARKP